MIDPAELAAISDRYKAVANYTLPGGVGAAGLGWHEIESPAVAFDPMCPISMPVKWAGQIRVSLSVYLSRKP